jgi:hypothetical protein
LKRFVEHDLHYEDYAATLLWYETIGQCEFFDDNAKAFLGCNDRFFLLAALLGRRDACHPWLFTRGRYMGQSPPRCPLPRRRTRPP